MSKKLQISSIVLLLVAILAGAIHAQSSLKIRKSNIMTYENAKDVAKAKTIKAPKAARRAIGETVSKAYGIRVYSDDSQSIDLVSFNVTEPTDICVEHTLPIAGVRAAACDGSTYYIFETEDAMTPSSFKTMDLATKEIKTVIEYKTHDPESPLIFFDMTWDPTTKQLYAYAFDLLNENNDYESGSLEGEIGLYKIDPATGRATLVGNQALVNFIALAINAEGYLFAMDYEGNLWEVDKRTGEPVYDVGYSLESPATLQSMSFDHKSGILYWSGFSVVEDMGLGFFSRFIFKEDCAEYEQIDIFPNTDEITGLYIDSNPLPETTPTAVSDLSVQRGENGSNTATVSWVNPSEDLKGDALTTSLNINIYRNDILVATLENQTPGQNASYTDTEVSGMTSYKVTAQNEAGEGKALYTTPLFIGADTPGAVKELACVKSSDNYDLTITWKAPEQGQNEGWYDQASLTYTVVRYPDEKTVAENITETTYTDATITETSGYYYVVIPRNNAGEGEHAQSNSVISGPALSVPFNCDFSTDAQYRLWKIFDEDQDGYTWHPGNNYAGTKDAFLKYFPENILDPDTETNDWFISAPIRLSSDKYYILRYSLRIFGGIGDMFPFSYNVTYGKALEPAQQDNILASYTKNGNEASAAFIPYTVTFRVSETGDYNFGFQARNAVMAQFTNISIEELPQTDLAALSIRGMDSPSIETATDFNIVVKNNGYNDITSYELKIVDENDQILATKSIDQNIKSQEEQTQTISWTPQSSGKHQIAAKVFVENDEVAQNDQSKPLAVNVLEKGVWHHYNEGDKEIATSPFYMFYPHSTTQIIYTKENLGASKGTIKGITYYYSLFKNQATDDFKIKISLANCNTEETGFDFMAPMALPKERFTQTFEGTLHLSPELHTVTILFDTPFEYTGGNLCLMSEQESIGNNSIVRWLGYYDYNDPIDHTLIYRGSEPFDYTQELTTSQEMANISLFMTGESAGCQNNFVHNTIDIRVDSKNLYILGDYTALNIYDLTGKLLESYNGKNSINLSKYTNGVYIIEVFDANNQRIIKKIALN